MAEQGRQLQEYVAQNKTAGDRSGPDWRGWLGRNVPSAPVLTLPSAPSLSWGPLDPDPLLPGLSGTQRLLAAGVCVAMAALCFGLAGLYVPVLVLRARKFAMLWSLGSALGLVAFALLRGPSRLMREPDPWSLLFVVALGGTLYAALGMRSTGLTLVGAAAQIVTAAGLLLGLLPGGAAGRRYIGGLCGSLVRKGVSKALPV
ncbi:vesicle transport protein SFT2C [Spea bombifrons]|uniref:vesicle transport protein SFT2C n=1 Tax=Spea bombifrons TaxID=233779 RepID=UPI0023496ADF|nr:vesicle transport protein SFT2C [Spea bombifrons]